MPKVPEKRLKPHWSTADGQTVRLYLGNVVDVLERLPERSVQCCVTSPPYWGLRDYGTGTWEGGDLACDHASGTARQDGGRALVDGFNGSTRPDSHKGVIQFTDLCGKCGAKRIDQQLGSEPSPDCLGWAKGENCAERCWASACHVCRMVLVFREVRRVMRDDGTLWLNYGDSYSVAQGGRQYGVGELPKKNLRTKGKATARDDVDVGGWSDRDVTAKVLGPQTPRPGNLCGVPWRVDLAMQADGWVLRQDIIWCLSGGTWVYAQTQKGEMPMMLRDAARLDPKTVKLWNGDRWTQVLGWSRSSREADELELVLRSGERIGCTPNHKFPTRRGLLEAGQLKVGDVLESTALPEPSRKFSPEGVSLEAAWFIGLYLAEGSRSGDKLNIAGHAKEQERWERVKALAEWYGGSATLGVEGNNQIIRISCRMLTALIDDHLNGRNAKDKSLKVRCWRYSNEWLLELLLGYLSGDGHWDEKNQRWRLGFCRNYSWERDLRTLAARIGFRMVLNPSFADAFGERFPTFRGEIRFTVSDHWNSKNPNEVMDIRKSRCREVYDVGVSDEPHVFALASGILTHNSKPSPMPESVRNRCTKAHEYVFLFAKRQGYFYDAEAIKEVTAQTDRTRPRNGLGQDEEDSTEGRAGCPTGKSNKRSVWSADDESTLLRWVGANAPELLERFLAESGNRGDVWRVASQGYPGAHFATFPKTLIEPMIKAGTSERGCCADCGNPWARVLQPDAATAEALEEARNGQDWYARAWDNSDKRRTAKSGDKRRMAKFGDKPAGGYVSVYETISWRPTCECHGELVKRRVKVTKQKITGNTSDKNAERLDANMHSTNSTLATFKNADKETVETVVEYVSNLPLGEHPVRPCTVLDPFMGSGTTAAVSVSLGRWSWGIELSQEYLEQHQIDRVERALKNRPHGLKLMPADDRPPAPAPKHEAEAVEF